MRAFIIQRLISLVPVLLGISILTFLLIHLVPVDPAQAYLSMAKIPPTDEAIATVRVHLGLDRPLVVQYMDWLKKASQLDFGTSFATQKPVLDEVLYHLPATLELTMAAMIWLIIISFPLGILSALYKDSLFDHFSRAVTFLGASVPNYWLGFLLIYLFSLRWGLLPVMGRGSWEHLILPSFTLSLTWVASYTKLLRSSILEQFKNSFVLYARARGIKERVIMSRHVLRNALVPVVISFGMSFGYMLAGSVIVENIFAWPGLGRLITSSIFNRDYPMIQAYVMLMAVIFVLCNLLVDLANAYLDPRIRIGDD